MAIAENADLASLKTNADKLDVEKIKHFSNCLISLKSKKNRR